MNFKNAFGAGDITCVAVLPDAMFVLEEIANFSISTHFDKPQVRRLGHKLPVGVATGSGTVAGTLVAKQMTRGALWKLRRYAGTIRYLNDQPLAESSDQSLTVDATGSDIDYTSMSSQVDTIAASILPQQLPSFHLLFVHANQSGETALARLYNINITDYSVTKGVTERQTEEMLQYKGLFYEQLQLRQSLDVRQMQELVGQQTGMFNDPRSPSLVSQVSSLQGVDSIGDYLEESTEESIERFQNEEPSTIGIADEGEVVLIDGEDQFEAEPRPELEEPTESLPDAREKPELHAQFVDLQAAYTEADGTPRAATLEGIFVHMPGRKKVYYSPGSVDLEEWGYTDGEYGPPEGSDAFEITEAVEYMGKTAQVHVVGPKRGISNSKLHWTAEGGGRVPPSQFKELYHQYTIRLVPTYNQINGVLMSGSLETEARLKESPEMEVTAGIATGTYSANEHYADSQIGVTADGDLQQVDTSQAVLGGLPAVEVEFSGPGVQKPPQRGGQFQADLRNAMNVKYKDIVTANGQPRQDMTGRLLHQRGDGKQSILRTPVAGLAVDRMGTGLDTTTYSFDENIGGTPLTFEVVDYPLREYSSVAVRVSTPGADAPIYETTVGPRDTVWALPESIDGPVPNWLGVHVQMTNYHDEVGTQRLKTVSALYDLRDPVKYTAGSSAAIEIDGPNGDFGMTLAPDGSVQEGTYAGVPLSGWAQSAGQSVPTEPGATLPMPGPANLRLPTADTLKYTTTS